MSADYSSKLKSSIRKYGYILGSMLSNYCTKQLSALPLSFYYVPDITKFRDFDYHNFKLVGTVKVPYMGRLDDRIQYDQAAGVKNMLEHFFKPIEVKVLTFQSYDKPSGLTYRAYITNF